MSEVLSHAVNSLTWQELRLVYLALVAVVWLILLASLVAKSRTETSQTSTVSTGGPPIGLKASRTILVLLIMGFIVAYSWFAITRHQRFNSTGYDLAINEQILWNTLHGRFFATSLEVENSFADHFRPFLLALLPFYAAVRAPELLVILQVIVLASAAIPLNLLALHKLKNQGVALVVVFAYLLYPSVGFIARFDFHIEVFAVPAFIAAFYAMKKGQWRIATLWLLIPLLCKETMGLTVAMFGLYALLMHRQKKWGLLWLTGGVIIFFVTSFWLIPTIRGEVADVFARYAWLGETPGQVLIAPFTQPSLIIRRILSFDILLYFLQISLPVGFLNLIGLPEFLLSAPGIAMNGMANHFCQPTIYCHYTVPIVPFVFIATVYGLYRLRSFVHGRAAWRAAAYLLIPLSLITFFVDNPFQEQPLLPSATQQISNAAIVSMALKSVPLNGSLVTTNDYAPHLARREKLYIIGAPSQRIAPTDPDVIFLNLYDQQYVKCDQIREYISKLNLDDYGVSFRTGGVIVMHRGRGSNDQFRDFVLNWNNCAG